MQLPNDSQLGFSVPLVILIVTILSISSYAIFRFYFQKPVAIVNGLVPVATSSTKSTANQKCGSSTYEDLKNTGAVELNKNYAVIDSLVYFNNGTGWSCVSGADIETFRVISSGFAGDKNYVYFWGKNHYFTNDEFTSEDTLDDPSHFELLKDHSEWFAKDSKNIYLQSRCGSRCVALVKISPNDNDTIILGGLYWKRGANVYYNLTPITQADTKTFKVLSTDKTDYESFAKDSTDVYFMGAKIDGADATSFVALGYGYAKDKTSVYRGVEELEGNSTTRIKLADPSSFMVLNDTYQKDKYRVYWYAIPFEGADSATFELINDHNLSGSFAKDKNHVYYDGKNIYGYDDFNTITENIATMDDPTHFRIIDGCFAIDSNNVYTYGSVSNPYNSDGMIKWPMNPLNVTFYGSCYATTLGAVFSNNFHRPLVGADPVTFKTVTGNGWDGEDSHAKYKNGQVYTLGQ